MSLLTRSSTRTAPGKRSKRSSDTRVALLPALSKAFSVNGVGLPAAANYVPDKQLFRMTQSVHVDTYITSSSTLPVFASKVFTLNDVPLNTAVQQVYDQYMIEQVEVWLVPKTSATEGAANSGLLISVIDYDDGNALPNVATAEAYANSIVTSGLTGHYRRFSPHVAMAAYSGAFTSFANKSHQWLDVASPGVEHYGVKFALTAANSATFKFDLIMRYHLVFRSIR